MKRTTFRAVGVFALAWTCVHSSVARAEGAANPASETCEAPAGASPALAAIDPATRTRFIRARLHRDASNARIWSWSWGLAYTAAGAVSFGIGLYESDKVKRTWDFIWAGVSLVPTALVVLFPLSVMADSRALDAVAESDLGTCAALARAEMFLERAAEQEESGTAWYNHALEIGINVALGVGLGYALDDWVDNSVSAGVGIAMGEAQIFTHPVGSIRARKRYLQGDLGSSSDARESVRWTVTPLTSTHASGVLVGVQF